MSWIGFANPLVYRFTQFCLYRPGRRRHLISTHVAARAGQSVLDIGCGPGTVMEHLPAVDYVGFDMNPRYIEYANRVYGNRGRFFCQPLTRTSPVEAQSRDIVMANAVLHHLNDSEALDLLRVAFEALRTGGRFISLDGYFRPGQSRAARWFLDHDRGHFVRSREEYEALIRQVFRDVKISVYANSLTIPYDLIIMESTK